MFNLTVILYNVSFVLLYGTILHFVFTLSPMHAKLLVLFWIGDKVLHSSVKRQYAALVKQYQQEQKTLSNENQGNINE